MQATPRATKLTHEQKVLRLARKRTLLRARDLTKHGLPTVTLTRLVQAGKLERAGRGLYSLPDAPISTYAQWLGVQVVDAEGTAVGQPIAQLAALLLASMATIEDS